MLAEDIAVPTLNVPILTISQIIKFVASAAEADFAGLYIRAKEMVPLRNGMVATTISHPNRQHYRIRRSKQNHHSKEKWISRVNEGAKQCHELLPFLSHTAITLLHIENMETSSLLLWKTSPIPHLISGIKICSRKCVFKPKDLILFFHLSTIFIGRMTSLFFVGSDPPTTDNCSVLYEWIISIPCMNIFSLLVTNKHWDI
jgi:hypothetical protein